MGSSIGQQWSTFWFSSHENYVEEQFQCSISSESKISSCTYLFINRSSTKHESFELKTLKKITGLKIAKMIPVGF